jgi:non-ribosomal peptide synthetase component F
MGEFDHRHLSEDIGIGRPLANTELYVFDKHLQQVPVGIMGELLIGGVRVARGYWKRPDVTAEQFIPHPFPTHTGRATVSNRGYGALSRGWKYRVPGPNRLSGEDPGVQSRDGRTVEAALCTHDLVKDAVVIAREERPDEKRLVAYIVPGKSSRWNRAGSNSGVKELSEKETA